MSEMTASEARARLAVVDEARVGHDPVFLTRRGRRIAAVVDADALRQLLQDAEDYADIQAAGEAAIPWDQVKADLGLS